jgi:hypothetical protein
VPPGDFLWIDSLKCQIHHIFAVYYKTYQKFDLYVFICQHNTCGIQWKFYYLLYLQNVLLKTVELQ